MAVRKLKTEVANIKTKEPVRVSHWEKRWNKWRMPVALLLLLVLYWLKTNSWPVVAVVNYRPIWRWQLDEQMYRQVGQQTLDNLVTEQVIKDELEAKKINVDPKAVDAKVEDIKKQIGTEESFNQALTMQGMTLDQLKKQISMQMALEKLVEPSTDSAKFQQQVYDLVQKLRGQAKVWTWPTSGKN